jgi:hypothetical protein
MRVMDLSQGWPSPLANDEPLLSYREEPAQQPGSRRQRHFEPGRQPDLSPPSAPNACVTRGGFVFSSSGATWRPPVRGGEALTGWPRPAGGWQAFAVARAER